MMPRAPPQFSVVGVSTMMVQPLKEAELSSSVLPGFVSFLRPPTRGRAHFSRSQSLQRFVGDSLHNGGPSCRRIASKRVLS